MKYTAGKHSYELVEDWARCPESVIMGDTLAVAIDAQDRVYVSAWSNPHIIIFDRDVNVLTSWDGEGQIKMPHSIYVGPDGSIYCVDRDRHVVMKFSFEGKLLQVLGNMDKPSSTGFPGVVHPEHYTGRYEGWARARDYEWLKTRIGLPFNTPCGVFVTPSGEIYVADGYGNARIHKFSSDGKLILSWGEIGDAPGHFICPHSVWVDKHDRVWVTDRENFRIQIFDTQGNFLSEWKTDLPSPCYTFIDNEEKVYVPEWLTQSLDIFTIDGKLIARWYNNEGEGVFPFITPHVAAVDSRGDIYVTAMPKDLGHKSLRKFVKVN